MAPLGAFWCPFLIGKPTNDRFSNKERGGPVLGRSVNRRGIIDRWAARRPCQLSVHSHGWELFSSDTSSYTHAHPIDFIDPDPHLLGKKKEMFAFFFLFLDMLL